MSFWTRVGVYKYLPIFFLAGAGIEWFMIHVRVGKETFCESWVDAMMFMKHVGVTCAYVKLYCHMCLC